MDYQDIRQAKDRFFAKDHRSPLPHDARHSFEGLDYYEPDPAYAFRLTPETEDGAQIEIGTSDGQIRTYRRAARVTFSVGSEERSLILLGMDGRPGYFLPFRDATSGGDTYGAGRYLDLEENEDGTVDVDFNLAYNPYCAYDDAYSCPLPPHANWLDVEIRAGERSFR